MRCFLAQVPVAVQSIERFIASNSYNQTTGGGKSWHSAHALLW